MQSHAWLPIVSGLFSGKTGLSGSFARLPAAPDMAPEEGALTKGRIGSILSPEPLQTLS
jgi:hypothetical protein